MLQEKKISSKINYDVLRSLTDMPLSMKQNAESAEVTENTLPVVQETSEVLMPSESVTKTTSFAPSIRNYRIPKRTPKTETSTTKADKVKPQTTPTKEEVVQKLKDDTPSKGQEAVTTEEQGGGSPLVQLRRCTMESEARLLDSNKERSVLRSPTWTLRVGQGGIASRAPKYSAFYTNFWGLKGGGEAGLDRIFTSRAPHMGGSNPQPFLTGPLPKTLRDDHPRVSVCVEEVEELEEEEEEDHDHDHGELSVAQLLSQHRGEDDEYYNEYDDDDYA
ncbi:hypothetical protein J437_LFUL006423 [Ladona fulva]|uniref:Uncharacterized protein n=1 Tax=Ladona fulva TaxID=123851 RepID=A0A8K0K5A6_LADFU|nr:hypothetical protein J437_LFUL006423 [Ladona fulva]